MCDTCIYYTRTLFLIFISRSELWYCLQIVHIPGMHATAHSPGAAMSHCGEPCTASHTMNLKSFVVQPVGSCQRTSAACPLCQHSWTAATRRRPPCGACGRTPRASCMSLGRRSPRLRRTSKSGPRTQHSSPKPSPKTKSRNLRLHRSQHTLLIILFVFSQPNNMVQKLALGRPCFLCDTVP